MTMRIVADEQQPSATIEIPLTKPLPDYDLEQLEQPTPRDVDSVLVSQGFRDLIDDARGVLLELLAHPPVLRATFERADMHFASATPSALELAQLTGAICPGEDSYRPGIWIVIRDPHAAAKTALPESTQERIRAIAKEFVERLQL